MSTFDFIKVESEMDTLEWNPPPNTRTLLICDAGGRVEAFSVEDSTKGPSISFPEEIHFSDILGPASKLTIWLAEQLAEARSPEGYWAETVIESNGKETGPLFVRIESLTLGGDLRGYAIHIFPGRSQGSIRAVGEGDAVVSKQQWHDIKNRLSVLKLYATLLSKSLPEGEDQTIVEKLLNGIDTLTKELAQIRRGDAR